MSGRDYGQRNFSYIYIFQRPVTPVVFDSYISFYKARLWTGPRHLLFIYFVSISIFALLYITMRLCRYSRVYTFEDCVHEIVLLLNRL